MANRWVFAERCYGAALRLLPAELRALYGPAMRADFSALAGAARGSGALAGWWVLMRGLFDVSVQGVRERVRPHGDQEGAARLWGSPRGRRSRPGEIVMQWWTEFRQAARSLAARPGFTLAAVLTLALGIGANVAIFAVVDAVLLRPLPYPESERMVVIQHHAPGLNLDNLENSQGTASMYVDWAQSFSAFALTDQERLNLTGVDRPAQVRVLEVTPGFFDVVGVQPARGRRFLESDVSGSGSPVCILTHAAWQARFGGADVIGRVVQIDGAAVEIVGVMPQGFNYPGDETEILMAFAIEPEGDMGAFGLEGIARLKPGVSVAAADREVKALQSRIPERNTDLGAEFMKNAGWSASVKSLRDERVEDVRTALWVVLATVSLVLLIACANVANLFLVRAEGRQRELAIRAALGASRKRLAWAFLSESLWLGAAGGVAGTAVATVAVRGLVAAGPPQLPRLHEVGIDLRTLLFAAALSLITGVFFGVLPLPRFLRATLELLREGRGGTATKARHRMRSLLIGGQVALALVLLVGSGLMLRSFQRLRTVDPGINTANVLTLGVSLGRYDSPGQAAAYYQRVLDEVAAVPGVVSVGATNSVPLRPLGLNGGSFSIESQPREDSEIPPTAMWVVASAGLLETLDMRVLQGRTMERRDVDTGAPVAWVNQAFVRSYLAGVDPLRERIRLGGGGDSSWLTIAGVVADVRHMAMAESPVAMVYLPMATTLSSVSIGTMHLLIRTAGEPMGVLPAVRATLQRVSGDVPLTTAATLEQLAAESMADTSFTMAVLGIAALVALLLGAIGLYGVITYVVAQRTRELGVRIALGAAPRKVQTMVVQQGLVIVALGLAAGLATALTLTRLMEGLLFGGISPRDPLTFGAVTAVLLAVSLAALYLPARRASSVNPMNALRAE